MARLTRTLREEGTVSSRFYRWVATGVWQHVLDALRGAAEAAGEGEWDLHRLDGSVVRAYQHAAGAKKVPRSRKPSDAVEVE